MCDRICQLQPVADLCDLVTVIPMLGTSRHWVIPWDHRIAMGLSHHDGMSHHHETSLLLIVIDDDCKSECDGGRNGAMDEHNDALPRTGMMDSWVYRSGYRS